jgi:xanthine dehydrogenase YagS FAD-binding subunit
VVRERFPALVLAAESVGSPELRNMGTIGGNLCQDTRCWYYRYPDKMGGQISCYRKGKGPCHAIKGDNRYHAVLGGRKCYAVCPSDLAIALAALQAEVQIARPSGERMLPLLDFYHPLGTALETDELITRIRIANPAENAVQRFSKFRVRTSIDFAVVSVAVVLEVKARICRKASIVLGAVAPTPYRAAAAEKVLAGKPLDGAHAEMAAEAALKDAKPLSRNAYKIEIAKTLVRRVLQSCESEENNG